MGKRRAVSVKKIVSSFIMSRISRIHRIIPSRKVVICVFCMVAFAFLFGGRYHRVQVTPPPSVAGEALPGFCVRCLHTLNDEPSQECELIDNNSSNWLHPVDTSDMPFWFIPTRIYAQVLPVLKIGDDFNFQLLPPQSSAKDYSMHFRYLKNTDLKEDNLFDFTDNWRLDLNLSIFDNIGRYERPSGSNATELEKLWRNGESYLFVGGRNSWMQLEELTIVKETFHSENADHHTLDEKIARQWRELAQSTATANWQSNLPSVEGIITYGYGTSYLKTHLRPLLAKYAEFIEGKKGVIVGSENPWLEYETLRTGADHVTTLEYLNLSGVIPKSHPRMSHHHPKEMERMVASGELWSHHEPFDFAMSYSSLEHPGLGRYSDPLNPEGDLMEMAKLSCLVKPGGLVFLGVPAKCDCLAFNLHRMYSHKRYALLMECFRPVEYEDLKLNADLKTFHQPWMVLQNLRGCLL